MILLALAFVQGALPTVGDTIWVTHAVTMPAGHLAQLPEWELEGDVELLGTPVLRRSGDTVTVAYPLVAWRPGTHPLSVPGPRLIAPDGQVIDVPPARRALSVASVLPDAPRDSLPIRPEAGVISRPTVSWLPLLALLLAACIVVLPAWWWWRRRGPAVVSPAPASPLDPPLEAWATAGEHRAVLAAATGTLREAVAARRPDIPVGLETAASVAALDQAEEPWDAQAVAALLRELDEARFGAGNADDVIELYHRARREAEALDEAVDGAPAP